MKIQEKTMLRKAIMKLCLCYMLFLFTIADQVPSVQVCDATGDDKNYQSR